MNYIELESYSRKWIFNHSSLPVNADDLANIKPFSKARAGQLWSQLISSQCNFTDQFSKGDWPHDQNTWLQEADWQQAWDNDDSNELPEEVLAHLTWDDNSKVYFCYERFNMIETNWGTFKRNWKNFLFYDDGALLISAKRKEVLSFKESGTVLIGTRAPVQQAK